MCALSFCFVSLRLLVQLYRVRYPFAFKQIAVEIELQLNMLITSLYPKPIGGCFLDHAKILNSKLIDNFCTPKEGKKRFIFWHIDIYV